MKEIQLTQGKVALVDDEDYDRLNQWNWRLFRRGSTCYAIRNIRKPGLPKRFYFQPMHREILGLTDPSIVVDHKDMDGLNNQKSNIRVCTRQQNNLNTRARSDNRCGVKGIYFDEKTNKYRARVKLNGKQVEVGRFEKIEDAAAARRMVASKLHGEFARHA